MRMASSSKRDYLAEYEAEQKNQPKKARHDTAVIGMRPRMTNAEGPIIEEFGELLAMTVGEEQSKFLAAVDVHVTDTGLNYAKEKTDDPRAVLSDLNIIVSTYHLVGHFMQSPVYKAAYSDDTAPEVYIFYFGKAGEEGWYISTKWFHTSAQKRHAEKAGLIKAYSPGVSKESLLELPQKMKVSMPHWQKKAISWALHPEHP